MSSPAKDRRPAPIVFGCAGPALSDAERRFFAAANPVGFILFGRNCDNPAQVQALVRDLRAAVGRAEAPVLIDQEGGRVSRLKPPHWRLPPPAARFAELYRRDAGAGLEATRLNARLIAADLAGLGIDVDCAPVLDLPAADAHAVIGDRAFGTEPHQVADLAVAFCDGLVSGGVSPVIKHIPGHGRARVDSHAALPVVEAAAPTLEQHDFAPFRALNRQPWAMTAHVLYQAFDAARPATLSPTVISSVIRGSIGFEGVLISDDLDMQALAGSPNERATAALAAGCDLALHCSGDLGEMQAIAAGIPAMTAATEQRLAHASRRRRPVQSFDAGAAAARIGQLLAAA